MEEDISLKWINFLKKASYGDYQLTEFINSGGKNYRNSFSRYSVIYESFYSSLDKREKEIFLNSI